MHLWRAEALVRVDRGAVTSILLTAGSPAGESVTAKLLSVLQSDAVFVPRDLVSLIVDFVPFPIEGRLLAKFEACRPACFALSVDEKELFIGVRNLHDEPAADVVLVFSTSSFE